jgi:hypothetical protein
VLADLDGNGTQDVIVEAGKPGVDGEVHAFSGADGKPLWKWLPPGPRAHRRDQSSRPALAVGDLDGDGRLEVVVLHTIKVLERRQEWPHAEVVVLDGAKGTPKWSWREPVVYQYNTNDHSLRSRVSPLLVNLGGKQRAICVWTYHDLRGGQIVLLDGRGKERRRLPVTFRLNGDYWRQSRANPQDKYSPLFGSLFRVWAVDLDGDGRDELVFFTSDRLCVMDGALQKVRWEWHLPEEECDLLDIRPATASHPVVLAVRAGSRVVFLADSPRPLWTCSGSGKPLGVAYSDDGPPRVFFEQDNQVTVCRLAQTDPGSKQEGAALPDSSAEDPRFVVPLPWVSLGEVPLLLSSPPALLAALLLVSLAVLVVPAAALVWAVRRRAWLLGALPLVWVALCWAVVVLLYKAWQGDRAVVLIHLNGNFRFALLIGLGLVQVAVAGVPVVAFAALALIWLRRRCWRRLALLLAGCVALAALVGWVWLASAGGPGPEQRYSWHGWYAVWPAGVYAVGVVIVAAVLLVRGARLGRAGIGWFRKKRIVGEAGR